MRTPVAGTEFPDLIRAEMKGVLCHGLEVVAPPSRFHQPPAGVGLVTEKQGARFRERRHRLALWSEEGLRQKLSPLPALEK